MRHWAGAGDGEVSCGGVYADGSDGWDLTELCFDSGLAMGAGHSCDGVFCGGHEALFSVGEFVLLVEPHTPWGYSSFGKFCSRNWLREVSFPWSVPFLTHQCCLDDVRVHVVPVCPPGCFQVVSLSFFQFSEPELSMVDASSPVIIDLEGAAGGVHAQGREVFCLYGAAGMDLNGVVADQVDADEETSSDHSTCQPPTPALVWVLRWGDIVRVGEMKSVSSAHRLIGSLGSLMTYQLR